VVQAMGMVTGLLQRWGRDRNRMLERQVTASDLASTMQSIIRFLRLSMQSVILGLGAYLVIERLATPGAMFAASILLGRALQRWSRSSAPGAIWLARAPPMAGYMTSWPPHPYAIRTWNCPVRRGL
jgi:ABC-type bacteriocin/lantibiotic exporter with double-glycine peptidase domain